MRDPGSGVDLIVSFSDLCHLSFYGVLLNSKLNHIDLVGQCDVYCSITLHVHNISQ